MECEADAPPMGDHRGRMGWRRIGWVALWGRGGVQRKGAGGEQVVTGRGRREIDRFPGEAHGVVFGVSVLWGVCYGWNIQQKGLLIGQNSGKLDVTFAERIGAARPP
jgi:hypothetical protein